MSRFTAYVTARGRAQLWGIWVCLLLAFWGLGLTTVRAKTPTVDEPVHIFRGYVLRQLEDLRQQYEHTPLSHRLIGILLLSGEAQPDVRELETWPTQDRPSMADELLWQSGLDAELTVFLGRLPILWLGLLLGALLVRWVWAWHGRFAAIVVAILFAFSPNLLASGAVATTDFVATATYLAAIAAWWHYWQRPSWVWWGLTAVAIGLALAAKLTGVFVLPLTGLLSYATWQRGESWWRRSFIWAGLLPVALFVVWVIYGFEWGRPPGVPLAMPAPTYIYSWQEVFNHMNIGHEAFFLGQVSNDGWWPYFVVTLLIKTPVVTLSLLVVALGILVVRWREWRLNAFMWFPPLLLLVFASYSRLNIGYRHILPALPFLLVAASSATPVLLKRRWSAALLGVGLLWYGVSGVWQAPHYLAYFNELVGGSNQGYRYLSDSNLDWGQSLKELAAYVSEVEAVATEAPVFISYSGAGDPAYYGVTQSVHFDEVDDSFAPANPAVGQYVLSTNHLQGLQKRDLYDWFRAQEPVEKLGYTLYVYEVAEQLDGEWIGHCAAPVPLRTPEEAEWLVGQRGLRHVYFDCEQTWVFPNNGRSGWYILPIRDEGWWVESLIGEPALLQPVYHFRDSPTYAVYYWAGAEGEMAQLMAGAATTGRLVNDEADDTADDTVVVLPVAIGDVAEVMAFVHESDTWSVLWQATTAAPLQLSLQAHQYGIEPLPQVADGLGYSSEQWQPQDFWIQRHTFAAMDEVRFLETNAYNYLNAEAAGEAVRLIAP